MHSMSFSLGMCIQIFEQLDQKDKYQRLRIMLMEHQDRVEIRNHPQMHHQHRLYQQFNLLSMVGLEILKQVHLLLIRKLVRLRE